MKLPLLTPETHWVCPNCATESKTREAKPHTRFHTCPGLHGLTAPMVQAGTKAKVEIREREDYIASEKVTLHEGRPVMAVVTERDNGQDVAVFAPLATASGDI